MAPLYEHIYVHLPFCEVICHYCDFYTARAKEARHADLFTAIHKELTRYQQQLSPKLKAIYFGGGTPSVSPPELLHKFLDSLAPHIHTETEITLEANPTNVSQESVRLWKEAGINRISLGIQSLDDGLLKRLGRVHSALEAQKALGTCLGYIPNVSGDLIYAVPDQSIGAPAEAAKQMAQIGVKHLSAYHLTLDKDHFLYSKLPPSELAYAQIQTLQEGVGALGFEHYEVSNFAQSGYESRNNQNYWRGGPYLALGPSAHGYNGSNKRWRNIADWEKYIELAQSNNSCVAEEETLSLEQLRIEFIFTRLRTREGLDLTEFERRFSYDLREKNQTLLAEWEKSGLAILANSHLKLSFSGRMLADSMAEKLL